MEIAKLINSPSHQKPWLKYYNKDTLKDNYPLCNIYDYLYKKTINNLNNIAITYYNRSISYKEFLRLINVFATCICNLTNELPKQVTIILPEIPELYYFFLALNKLGILTNIININSSINSILLNIKDDNSSDLIILDSLYFNIKNMLNLNKYNNIITINLNDSKQNKNPKKNKHKDSNVLGLYDFLKLNNNEKTKTIYKRNNPILKYKNNFYSNDNFLSCIWQFNSANKLSNVQTINTIYDIPIYLTYQIILLSQANELILNPMGIEDLNNMFLKIPNLLICDIISADYIMNNRKNKNFKKLKDIVLAINKNENSVISKMIKINFKNAKLIKNFVTTQTLINTNINDNYTSNIGLPLLKTNIAIWDCINNKELFYNTIGEICINIQTQIKNSKKVKLHSDGKVWYHTNVLGYLAKNGDLYIYDKEM